MSFCDQRKEQRRNGDYTPTDAHSQEGERDTATRVDWMLLTRLQSLPGSASAVTPITTTLSSPIVIQKRKWQDDVRSLRFSRQPKY